MPTVTQHAPGTFSWPELATKDPNGAKTFYSTLFGWTYEDQDMGPDGVYTTIHLKGQPVGALYQQRDEDAKRGIPPHWASYVTVESADATAKKAKELGGTLLAEPFDVVDFGRMAVIQDPQGAVICVWQAKKHIGAHILGEPGSLVWTELFTTDAKSGEAFYTKLFPWQTSKMPSLTGGEYTVFAKGPGPQDGVGGMLQITKEMGPVPPHWFPYFGVEDCDAIVAKAKGMGAQVHMTPTDIPNVGRFAVLGDPQGAAFAIIKTLPM